MTNINTAIILRFYVQPTETYSNANFVCRNVTLSPILTKYTQDWKKRKKKLHTEYCKLEAFIDDIHSLMAFITE